MTNDINIFSFLSYFLIGLGYIAYNVITINFLIVNIINDIWIYNLLSLIILPLYYLISVYGYRINFKFIQFIFLTFFIWAMFLLNSNTVNKTSNIYYNTIFTSICQILVAFSTIILNFYMFLCQLKTPCCCYTDTYYDINSDDDEQKENV